PISGVMSGGGAALIDGAGSFVFEAASSVNVTFAADAVGTLQLGDAFHFNGTITGFNNDDAINLLNVNLETASFSYAENDDHTGGSLTISDGLNSNSLVFVGDYD